MITPPPTDTSDVATLGPVGALVVADFSLVALADGSAEASVVLEAEPLGLVGAELAEVADDAGVPALSASAPHAARAAMPVPVRAASPAVRSTVRRVGCPGRRKAAGADAGACS